MIFRQLLDAASCTWSYLLGDPATRTALLIDPVRDQIDRDVRLIDELGLRLVLVLDTHVHADHVTAAGALRQRFGVRTAMGKRGASCVDVLLDDGGEVELGAIRLRVLPTPGHTDDSVSYYVEESGRVFTGDALLIRGCGRTDFQGGDAAVLYDSITRVLFALPGDTLVHPAHDYKGMTVSTIGEEKRCNPRLVGKSRDEFVAIMRALNLPPPAKIDEAVPANRACGLAAPPSPLQG